MVAEPSAGESPAWRERVVTTRREFIYLIVVVMFVFVP